MDVGKFSVNHHNYLAIVSDNLEKVWMTRGLSTPKRLILSTH